MLDHLAERHGEMPVGEGITNAGGLVQLLAGRKPGGVPTWSIIITIPGGQSCLIAAGQEWRPLLPLQKGPRA